MSNAIDRPLTARSERGSTTRKPRRKISFLLFMTCGIWLIALGLYFALLRPALLPEDPRYIGSSLAQIQTALPGLERWLRHVFIVMGGFMAASGLLTMFLAATAISARQAGTGIVLLLAGLATVVTMSWTNFVIDSNFKWLLLAPAVLWIVGIAAYALEPHDRPPARSNGAHGISHRLSPPPSRHSQLLDDRTRP